MSSVASSEQASFTFDFTGDHLCLDFTNTLADRELEKPTEHLHTYADLLSWSEQARLITPEQAARLQEEAQRSPQEAGRVFARAIELRELMRRIFLASALKQAPADEDLKLLSTKFAETMAKGQLVLSDQHYTWRWPITEGMLDGLFGYLLPAAIALLTSKELSLVHVCAAEDCGWLFLDLSKNHSRRWCDMKSCGNRAKVRKFYQNRVLKSSSI